MEVGRPQDLPPVCFVTPPSHPGARRHSKRNTMELPRVTGTEASSSDDDFVGHGCSFNSPESHGEKVNPFFSSNLSNWVKARVSVKCHYVFDT